MNILVRNTDNIVTVSTNKTVFINSEICLIDNKKYVGINNNNHTLHQNITLPENYIDGVFTYINGLFSISDQQLYDQTVFTLNEQKKDFLNKVKESHLTIIDRLTDTFIKSIVGERINEYIIAENEAKLYKESNYTLDPIPVSIQTDAIANNRTPQEAADDIINMANQWRQLQMQHRADRLLAKANIRNSTTEKEIKSHLVTFEGSIEQLRQLA